MKEEIRSSQQNKSYWLFQQMICDTMIDSGINLNSIIKNIEIRPTKNNLHEIFKAILYAKYGKDTTKEMDREQMNEVLTDYMKALSLSGIVVDFPDRSMQELLNQYK